MCVCACVCVCVSLQDVSDETYNEFFKTTFSEFLDPLAHVHFNVEVGARTHTHTCMHPPLLQRSHTHINTHTC